MHIRSLLRTRVHVSIGLAEPTLPSLQASADDAPVGRWFSANLGVGNLLTVLGLSAGLVSGYATLKTEASESTRRLDNLNQRVVSRTEIEGNNAALNLRITTLEAGQSQIVQHLLAGCR